MSAAQQGFSKGQVYRATSYSHLGRRDIAKLTAILRDSPLPCDDINSEKTQKYIRRVKKATQALPPHLLRNSVALKISNIFMKNGDLSRAGLCHNLHEKLPAKLVQSIFSWIRHEIEEGIPRFFHILYFHNALTPEQEKFVRYLELIPEMWQNDYDARKTAPPNREPIYSQVEQNGIVLSRWAKGQHQCPACMLARIGGSYRACYGLLLGILARWSTAKTKADTSRRLQWVERWVHQFQPGADRFAWPEAQKLKEIWKDVARQIRDGEFEDPLKRSPTFSVESTAFVGRPPTVSSNATAPVDVTEPYHPDGGFPSNRENPFKSPFESPPTSPRHSNSERELVDDQSEYEYHEDPDKDGQVSATVNPWDLTNLPHPAASSIYSQAGASPASIPQGNAAAYAADYASSLGNVLEDEPQEGVAPPATEPLFARDAWINYNNSEQVDNGDGAADKSSGQAVAGVTPYKSIFENTVERSQSSRRPERQPAATPRSPLIRNTSVRRQDNHTGTPGYPAPVNQNPYEFQPSPVSSRAASPVTVPGRPYSVSPLSSSRPPSPPREQRDPRFNDPNWIQNGIRSRPLSTASTAWEKFYDDPREIMAKREREKAKVPPLPPVPRMLQNPFSFSFNRKGKKKDKDKEDKDRS
ncbi:uncharacterized protein BDZ99DRAFT_565857 [Mytilinidion resinicola]|uniref:Uncharacterized protein n=1 Tax=Mytilinidion resinicola TaxID=574789 RepID=A0A6A6Z6U8_9PEZI|nr:uncharacterized protein BDZ99DRAFT_565857 [Mytilinidion resinicola]KAF2815965.1 hypothetical protein BDZ99DRAFT_565857 [Mytilinidion resinicola]